MDAHAERSSVPRLLHRPLHFRQRHRVSALCIAGGGRRVRARDGRLLERVLRHSARLVSGGEHDERRPAPALSAGSGTERAGDRRRRRVTDRQRGIRPLRAGSVAANQGPHCQLRPALGRAAHARNRGSGDDGLRRVPQRPGFSVRRHDPRSVGHDSAARRRGVGHRQQRQATGARQRRRVFGAAEHAVAGRNGDDQRAAAADALRRQQPAGGFRRDDADVAGSC